MQNKRESKKVEKILSGEPLNWRGSETRQGVGWREEEGHHEKRKGPRVVKKRKAQGKKRLWVLFCVVEC